MRLLEVNGTSLLGATHQEAVNILRSSGNAITLVVCKGYDKSNEYDQTLSISGRESKESRTSSKESKDTITVDDAKSLSQSVSSLDRDDEEAATLRQEQEMKAEMVAWEQEERERALLEQREKTTPEKVRVRAVFRSWMNVVVRRWLFFLLLLGSAEGSSGENCFDLAAFLHGLSLLSSDLYTKNIPHECSHLTLG